MKRPVGVTILSVVMFLAAAIGLVMGLYLLIQGHFSSWMLQANPDIKGNLLQMARVLGLIVLAVGTYALAAGIGFFQGKKWGWWMVTAMFILSVISDVAKLFMGQLLDGIVGTLVVLLILYYLLRPSVRQYFK